MMRCLLAKAVAAVGERPALLDGQTVLGFAEWEQQAMAVAAALQRRGVGRGERVALLMPSDWRLPVIIFGVLRLGAMVCPLSTRLPPTAVAAQLSAISCHHLVTDPAQMGDELPPAISLHNPEELLYGRPLAEVPPLIDPAAPAIVLFTSGSSGTPRPAVLTYGNMYHNACGANANLPLDQDDRWLLNLPLYHVSGLSILFRCLLARAAVVIATTGESPLAALRRLRPTFVSMVPTQLHDLLTAPEGDTLAGVKVVLLGGAQAPPALLARARKHGWPVFPTYGMTETASQIATASPNDGRCISAGSSGNVLPGREVMIAGDGEILVRGPCLFAGYYTPNGLVLPLDRDGWFHTGDLGSFDEFGRLTVLGRKDALIISGGENIQPEEVEAALLALGGIVRALVVPVAHSRFGQRPVAFIETDGKEQAWPTEHWRRQLAFRLASFKIPDFFYPFPAEEKSGLKVSRPQLTQTAEILSRQQPSAENGQGLA